MREGKLLKYFFIENTWMDIVEFLLVAMAVASFLITIFDKFHKWQKYIIPAGFLASWIFIWIISNSVSSWVTELPLDEVSGWINTGIIVIIFFALLFFIKYQIDDIEVQYACYGFLTMITLFILLLSNATSTDSRLEQRDLILLIKEYELQDKHYDTIRILEYYASLNEVKRDKSLLKRIEQKLESVKKVAYPFEW